MTQLITKSRMAAHNGCQRLHKLLYVDGYRALQARDAADFGNMWHAGMDAWWRAQADGGDAVEGAMEAMARWRAENHRASLDRAQVAKAEILVKAYDARWVDDMADLEVLAIEVEFSAPIPGMKGVRVGGKIDKLVRRRSTGEVGFVEHKTTSADVGPESTYWTQLRINTQISVYYLGAQALGHDPTFCIYDVVSRPSLRPLKATPVEARKYTKATAKEPSRPYAGQRETDETDAEFEVRMAGKILASPDDHIARATVPRLEAELDAALDDLRQTAAQIRTVARTGIAPRNPDHCFHWGRACEFFDVCSGVADLDDASRFERLENVHPELDLVTIKKPRKRRDEHADHDSRQAIIPVVAGSSEGISANASPAE